MKRLLLTLSLLVSTLVGFSQCPPNINFENGNLIGWNCWVGTVGSGTGTCIANCLQGTCTPSIPTWNPNSTVSPVANRHQVMSGSTLDPYFLLSPNATNCPVVCPYITGNSFSLKLGNDNYFDSCERVVYTFTIPTNMSYYTLTYWYAIVLENPGCNHRYSQMPRFQVTSTDITTGLSINCATSNFVCGSSMPGFYAHAIGPYDTAMCKNWSPAFLNFKNLQGHTISIEFFTSDCTLGAHFGYAYIDFDQCATTYIKLSGCANSGFDTLIAPPGFQTYQWYDSLYNPIVNGNSDTLTIPSLTDTTKFYLAFYPYSGFGCPDTIPILVSPLTKPIANFGFKDSICPGLFIQFHDSSKSSIGTITNWYWNFGDPSSVNNTSNLQNPTHNYLNLGTYTISLVSKTNKNCLSDTIFKIIHIVNTNSVYLLRDTTICYGDTVKLLAISTPQTWNWSPSPISSSLNWAIYIPVNTTKVKVQSASVCSASDSVIINVNHVKINSK
jgi:PKD repeat protein